MRVHVKDRTNRFLGTKNPKENAQCSWRAREGISERPGSGRKNIERIKVMGDGVGNVTMEIATECVSRHLRFSA